MKRRTSAFILTSAVAIGLAVLLAGPPAQAQTLPPVTLPPVTLPTVTFPPLPVVPLTVPTGVLPGGLFECTHFLTQQAAQLSLDTDPLQASLLDPDGDGTACPLLRSGSATATSASGSPAVVGATTNAGGPGATTTGSGVRPTAPGPAAGSSAGARSASELVTQRLASGSPAGGAGDENGADKTGSLVILALLALLALLAATGGGVAVGLRSRSVS